MASLPTLAEALRALHRGGTLVLPNAWDAESARAIERAGFPAVATTSNAIAASLGHPDGEGAPWSAMFAAAERIAAAVAVPVTVDAEAGYGMSPDQLVERLLATGAVGCNLEDSKHPGDGLRDTAAQAAFLASVRAAASRAGVPVVVNARIDVFLPSSGVPADRRVDEAATRARAYLEADADCVYPIGVRRRADLEALMDEVQGPINANVGPELDLATLRALGVARVSYGPQLFRRALSSVEGWLAELHDPARP